MSATRKRGFTLIELMVAMAIAVILIVLAAPSYGLWIADQEIHVAAQNLADGLRYGHAEAIKRNARVEVVVNNATGSGGWTARLADGSGTVIQVGVFKEGSNRVVFTATPNLSTITFTPFGNIDTANFDTTLPFTKFDLTMPSVAGTRPLRVTVGGGAVGQAGVKICDPAWAPPDPKSCPF